mmetsp:Transcript_166245/g.403906  ORF Transcript_166245/g.403906 Transcript_166245/m.403906 type:complete len:211 (-) Transcript_166245:131-763(-)
MAVGTWPEDARAQYAFKPSRSRSSCSALIFLFLSSCSSPAVPKMSEANPNLSWNLVTDEASRSTFPFLPCQIGCAPDQMSTLYSAMVPLSVPTFLPLYMMGESRKIFGCSLTTSSFFPFFFLPPPNVLAAARKSCFLATLPGFQSRPTPRATNPRDARGASTVFGVAARPTKAAAPAVADLLDMRLTAHKSEITARPIRKSPRGLPLRAT